MLGNIDLQWALHGYLKGSVDNCIKIKTTAPGCKKKKKIRLPNINCKYRTRDYAYSSLSSKPHGRLKGKATVSSEAQNKGRCNLETR